MPEQIGVGEYQAEYGVPSYMGMKTGFAVIATAIALTGLHSSFASWLRTALSAFGNVTRIFHRTRHHTSHALVLNSRPLGELFDSTGAIWKDYTDSVNVTFGGVAHTVERLRYVTLPHEIRVAVHPVARTAEHALDVGIEGKVLGRRNDKALGHKGIDKLRRNGLWPVVAGLAAFDLFRHRTEQRYKGIEHGVRKAGHDAARANTRAGVLERTTVKTHSRAWHKVLELTTVAGFAAVMTRALWRKFPWMRCNNFNRLSRALRCSHLGFLADLLTLGLALLSVVDPVVIAKAAILSEEGMDVIVRKIAELNPEPPV